jgi:hypothetical protein
MGMERGHAIVRSSDTPGEILIPDGSGDCHGGRFAARVRIAPSTPSGRPYESDIRISGARFGPLLNDLTAAMGEPLPPPPLDTGAGDLSRGQIDGEFSLRGVADRPETRRGRGSFRISGGRIVNFPFMTRLVEVSNLVMPGNARLDYASGTFYLEGGLITFDALGVHSRAIAIEGGGTMTWPEKILNLQFNSRSERPIPVFSALVEGIRDQLVTTVVTGKLGRQEVHLQQLPSTRVLSRETAQSRRMAELQRRSRDQSIRPANSSAITPSTGEVTEAPLPPPAPPSPPHP